jgi:hypothetical protein
MATPTPTNTVGDGCAGHIGHHGIAHIICMAWDTIITTMEATVLTGQVTATVTGTGIMDMVTETTGTLTAMTRTHIITAQEPALLATQAPVVQMAQEGPLPLANAMKKHLLLKALVVELIQEAEVQDLLQTVMVLVEADRKPVKVTELLLTVKEVICILHHKSLPTPEQEKLAQPVKAKEPAFHLLKAVSQTPVPNAA